VAATAANRSGQHLVFNGGVFNGGFAQHIAGDAWWDKLTEERGNGV
jgi:hypothetical protein